MKLALAKAWPIRVGMSSSSQSKYGVCQVNEETCEQIYIYHFYLFITLVNEHVVIMNTLMIN